jgi:hypothetical protein
MKNVTLKTSHFQNMWIHSSKNQHHQSCINCTISILVKVDKNVFTLIKIRVYYLHIFFDQELTMDFSVYQSQLKWCRVKFLHTDHVNNKYRPNLETLCNAVLNNITEFARNKTIILLLALPKQHLQFQSGYITNIIFLQNE